jgi:hypothetical protein
MGRRAKNKQPPPAPLHADKKPSKRKLDGDGGPAKFKKAKPAGGKTVRFGKAKAEKAKGPVEDDDDLLQAGSDGDENENLQKTRE